MIADVCVRAYIRVSNHMCVRVQITRQDSQRIEEKMSMTDVIKQKCASSYFQPRHEKTDEWRVGQLLGSSPNIWYPF